MIPKLGCIPIYCNPKQSASGSGHCGYTTAGGDVTQPIQWSSEFYDAQTWTNFKFDVEPECQRVDKCFVRFYPVKLHVIFLNSTSWKRDDLNERYSKYALNLLLVHEQIHVYIIYKQVAELEKIIASLRVRINGYDMKSLSEACKKLKSKIKEEAINFKDNVVKPLQEKYDRETDHGRNEAVQIRYINDFLNQ